MRWFPVLALLVGATASFGFLGVSAQAGDYYNGGYRNRDSGNVSYNSNCCYKKVVSYVRTVRYVRTARPDEGRSYYNDRPYRQTYYSDAPRRYVSDNYVPRRYADSNYSNDGYSSYRESCTWRRDRIDDGQGGWVWGNRHRVCH